MQLNLSIPQHLAGSSRQIAGVADAYDDLVIAAGTNVLQAIMTKGTPSDWRSSAVLRDVSRNGTLRTIQPGRCYDFDGVDDTISATSPFSSSTTASLSISAWVKLDTAANFAMIVAWGTSGKFDLRFATTTRQPQVAVSGGPSITAASAIALDTWVHLCTTYSAGTLNLYVNGVAETPAGPTGTSIDFSAEPTMYMGSRGGSQFFHDGKIFDVRVYSSVLTAGQALALSSRITGRASSLSTSRHFKLDDASTSTARDSSGSAAHGTVAGTAGTYTGTDVPWSWQNEVGYTDGAANTFVPRDESNTSKDVLGASLGYSGEVPYDADVKTSGCVTLNITGSDDYVLYTAKPIPASTSALTVSIWATISNTATHQMLFSDANNTEMRINSSEQVELILTNSGVSNIQLLPSDTISTGTWINFLFTFNSGSAELFVNGVSISTASDAAAGWDTFRWDDNWRFGQRTNNTLPLLGSLRNCAVWNRVLTATEIAVIFANGEVESGLIHHWPMGERNGSTVYDPVGGINGTMLGGSAATWTRAGAVITATFVAHGMSVGQGVTITSTSDAAAVPSGHYMIATAATADVFTVTGINAGGASGTATFFGRPTTQNDYHYNAKFGSTVYTGVRAKSCHILVPNTMAGVAMSHSAPSTSSLVYQYGKSRLGEGYGTSIDTTKGIAASWQFGRSQETAYVFGTDRTSPKYVNDPENGLRERMRAGTATAWTVYGTSLSANGANQWQDNIATWIGYLNSGLTKVNRGAPGEASSYGLTNIALVTGDNPNVVTLEWCMNDAYTPYAISVAQARSNHEDMIDAIWAAHSTCKIILITTNGTTNVPSRPNVSLYYQMYRDLVADTDDSRLTICDWNIDWAAMENASRATYLTYVADDIHPDETGSNLIQVPYMKSLLCGYTRRLITLEA